MSSELSNADRIVLLAATIEDYLPGPWMGRREWSAEGPSEKRLCKRCEGQGQVQSRQGRVPCDPCGGKGSVLVDAYTGRIVGKMRDPDDFRLADGEIAETLAGERADFDARQRRRRRIDRVLGEERVGEDWVDWILRRKRALYRDGDYRLLERMALELPAREQAAFWAVYGPRSVDRVAGPRLRASAARALALLDNLMPNCRVPGWLAVPRGRDAEIRVLNDRGLAQAAIAARVGVSQQTVSRVLREVAA